MPSTWRSIAAWAASGSPSAIAETIGSWLACETRPGQARAGDDAQHLGDLDLDLRLGRDQAARARGLGDRDVEARVGQPEAGEGADGALGGGRRFGDCLTSVRPGPLGGERRRLARDGAPPVGQLAQRTARRRLAVEDERGRRVVAHEGAAGASAPCLDEAGGAQDLQRLAQRHGRDAELGGELELAREPLPGRQHAGADRLAEASHDLLDGPLRLERSERDVAGCGGHLNTITSR